VAKTVQLNIRLSPEEVVTIDKWIENGDFDNRTEFVRFALKKILVTYDGDKLDFKSP